MLVELFLSDKGPANKIDTIFGMLLTLTNTDGRQLMSFGTLDTKSKELVMEMLINVVSASYVNMRQVFFFFAICEEIMDILCKYEFQK